MSRRVAALMATAAITVAGVALAAVITCTGGRCEGTNDSDQITGSEVRDRIFALDDADRVEARGRPSWPGASFRAVAPLARHSR